MEFNLNVLKYEDIYNNIVDFIIQSNPQFSSFDFTPSSNIGLLVNGMAYITMLLNYQVSNLANNIFLDTTNIRSNAVSIAKTLGYIPQRNISATISGTFNYSGSNFNQNTQVIIPQNTVFTSIPSGYSFINLQPITLTYVSPILLSAEFILTQGTWTSYSYISNGLPYQSFTIPDTTVENSNLILTSVNNTTGNTTNWTQVSSFGDIQFNQPIYFVQESINQEYCPTFIFGNGVIGKIPTINDIINVNYLSSNGSTGNGETGINIPNNLSLPTSPDIIFNVKSFSVSIPSNSTSVGGSNPESLQSIQTNAPLYFNTSGRTVTKNDYLQILPSLVSGIYVNVAGSEDIYGNNPEYLGNVYICGVPQLTTYLNTENLYLSNIQESSILDNLKNVSILGVYKNIVKPTYILVNVSPFIKTPSNTSQTIINNTISQVTTNIQNYFNTITQSIGESYINSQVITAINNTPGVVSSIVETSYGFLINQNSFYTNKSNFNYLPTVQLTDSQGNIIYNAYNVPETKNFIKTNSEIVTQTNQEKGTDYTVTTLPPDLSSIYGTLAAQNINRIIYSQDYFVVQMCNIFIVNNVSGVIGINFESLSFQDINNTNHTINLIDSGTNSWNIYLDSIGIGTLTYSNGVFSVNIFTTQETYLTSLGFSNPIDVVEVQVSTSQVYYQIQTVLNNSNIANIIIQGNNILGQLQVTSTTNPVTQVVTTQITLNNPLTLTYQGQTYNVNLINATETSATLMFGTQYTICNVDYSNGSFSLTNVNGSNLNLFGFQNSINLDTNNNLNVLDIYNNASVGNFNYQTGLLNWNDIVSGFTGTTSISAPLYSIFNGYSQEHPVDVINIVPDNQYNSSGQIIGTLTDFNGNWSQFIVPEIQPVQIL